jgi:hypothetical protein
MVSMVEGSRNSGGVYSLPAGNPVVTGTTITSTWANNTLNDVGAEITSSLDRAGRGAMTAPLQLATGSCAAPSLTFSAEADVGLYRAGSNDTKMCIASAAIQQWVATGAVFPLAASVTGLLTTSGGITAGQSASNTAAITATGNGTGAGCSGVAAAATNSVGVLGTATTDSGSTGVKGVATTRYGVKGEATSGLGVFGSATSGVAVYGGATTGVGVSGESTSTIGVRGYGVTYGVYGENTSSGFAIGVGTGHMQLAGSNPASTTGFANTLTPSNVPKAWGAFTCSAGCTMNGGFNIAGSFGASTDECKILTFGTAMANSNYGVMATGVECVLLATPINTSTFKLCCADSATFSIFGSGQFVVFGTQ